jgi:uncharacterized membrane protein YphA (DoxX/SURF4 family)
MDTALWIVQVLLALLFLMAGLMKATQPREKLAERTPYVEDLTDGQLRTIGILELLGAVGLVLPALTGILPWLTPLAAVGLALTMVGAIIVHFRRGEYPNIIMNVVLLGMALFVASGRFVIEPF